MYVPSFRRLLNRDPLGEEGGANLYHYCGNDPINRIDALGLQATWTPPRVHKNPEWGPEPIILEKVVVIGTRLPGSVYRWGSALSGDAMRAFLERHSRSGRGEGPRDGGAGGGGQPSSPPPESPRQDARAGDPDAALGAEPA